MTDPANRRRYPRFDIELRGQISAVGGTALACLVRDFCQGGVLVQSTSNIGAGLQAHFSAGQEVRVATRICSGDGERRLTMSGTVVWVRGQYIGLAFKRPSAAVVDVLRKHERVREQRSSPSPAVMPHGETRALSKLRHTARGELPGILRALMSDVGQALLDRAERVGSNSERQQVFVDMAALERLRRDDSLIQAVLAQVEGSASEDDLEVGGELSLVDTDDFERWLEASRAHTVLDRRFAEQLSALGSRLAALRHDDGPLAVPFEPQHFTAAFRSVARELELGAVTRSVLFERATEVLGDRLGEFYRRLDETLDGLGAPAARQQPLRVLHPPSGTAKNTEAPPAQAIGPPGSARPGHATAGPVDPSSLVSVDAQVLEQLLQHERQQREEFAHDLMEHVGELPNMTESLQSWLSMLDAPMREQAVADEAFFQNPQHPLRQIVDALGHLQMFRAMPDAASEDDPLRAQVNVLLAPIGEGRSDPETLRRVADSVTGLTLKQSQLYQRNVERVAEASQGKDRLRQARQAVVGEINRRYAGKRVPELLLQLLDAGWRAVLELSAINDDAQSRRLDAQLALTDMLVDRLGGEAFAPVEEPLSGSDLMAQLCGELADVAFDPFRRNAVEKRMRQELAGPAPAEVALVEMPLLHDDGDETDDREPPAGVSPAIWRQQLDRCEQIQVGDRLRFLQHGDASQDLRVAWIRDDRRLFVMVDHRGLRVRDIDRAALALGLHQRQIELLRADGQPLSDRAVDAILDRLEARLAHQASHDSLTGLINRQQFSAALEQALHLPGRDDGTGALMWIDVDQFRLINDIHGYETGDRLLMSIARQLDRAPGAKVLGHLGGDRFALLMPDVNAEVALQRASAIVSGVQDAAFEWDGQRMAVTVSVGLVGMLSADSGSGALLRAAENALRAAKVAGGNQVFVYREDDPGITRQRESVRWVAQVDEALENGQLHLRCQPIVPVKPNQGLVPHYEVLLGVSSGSDKALPIAEFIDAAERYNRMRAVDRWVARTVMEWIAAHREHMHGLHGFAVNLSGQTASDPSFVDFVREQFQRTGIDPAWVSFEVTETAAVSDLSNSAGIVSDLKALGCKVALDDFGSGLASYSYLKELPVDWLKIDGAFVRKIANDPEDYAVVKSINEIGHFLGKKTIAEYVADEKLLRMVTEIGVDYAQGYGIAPPSLLDDLLKIRASA